MGKTVRVAVSQLTPAADKPYEYALPEELWDRARPGMRVLLPFGRGSAPREGMILSVGEEDGGGRPLKQIFALADSECVLTPELLRLALWMRDRFFCTVYDAVKAMLPTGLWLKDGAYAAGDKTVSMVGLAVSGQEALDFAAEKEKSAPMQAAVMRLMASVGEAAAAEVGYFTGASSGVLAALVKKGLLQRWQETVFRRVETEAEPAGPLRLTEEQERAFQGLEALRRSGESRAALLYGVTGSGKTLVYIRLIQEALRDGRGAIVLVPEISLTPQLMQIFASYFGDAVAVLHSSLSIGQRYDEWKRIRAGLAKVVIGTRSAVFAPVENPGLLILDEEQEYTYKSEQAPRYHARDVAKYRCVQNGALLVLGSATPSVASMYHARSGRYSLFTLENRYNGRPLPRVELVDMRQELRSGNGTQISAPLRRELERNLETGRQSILFLNRRGAAGLVMCPQCGHTFTCSRCSVSMTYHSANGRLMCHYCGASRPLPAACPECGGRLKFVGAGTQKVEEELHALLGDEVGVLRMDADTVSPLRSHERLLETFRREKTPILVGTQMVTKGLDFENVTLVGVLCADQALYMPDYRAQERAFSLITQVVGRAGRGGCEGRAVIQSFTPENEVIRLAARQDYPAFYERDVTLRRLSGAPPFSELFTMTVSSTDEALAARSGVLLRDRLAAYFREIPGARVLGPAPASVARVSGRYRYQVTVCCENSRRTRDILSFVLREFAKDKACRGASVYADVDPVD